MFKKMQGKTAVITGATSGIGEATARLLASLKINVALAGRNVTKGKQLEKELSFLGTKALFIQTDVSNSDSVTHLIETTKKSFGAIHFALNNAGIEGNLGPLVKMDERDFDEVIATNLKSIWLCLKEELKSITTPGASIVNISTNITHLCMQMTGAYTASKAGVESLTKVAALEHGKEGIRVNAISPGAVDTPMIHRIFPSKEEFNNMSQKNPTGRMALPEDIANTVLWLFSPLSGHVNGHILVVDGGDSISG